MAQAVNICVPACQIWQGG